MTTLSQPSEHDIPTLSEAAGIRYLHFGTEWIQGAMAVADPPRLVLEYTRQMMAWLLFTDPPRAPASIGILGLGAGSLVRYCLKHTASRVRAVEWNPMVVTVCQMYFRLPVSSRRLDIVLADAGDWVGDPANHGSSPVLMVDLYDAEARGPVRDSLEFYTHCRQVLGERGILTVNLFGEHESFPRNLHHLDLAFDGRVMVLPEIDAGNRIALCFAGEPFACEPDQLLDRAETVEAKYGLPARRWARALMRGAATGGRRGARARLQF